MEELNRLLHRVADEVTAFRGSLAERPVRNTGDLESVRRGFATPLPQRPSPAAQVIEDLVAAARTGLMATPGPRFFGFVVGGALPAATAADMLAVGWDQCAFNTALAPAASAAEEVAGGWLKELLGIPSSASVGFVTGAQSANTVGLTAARHHVLAEAGWDVERRGLQGAPSLRVVASEERHATIDRSLRLLGLGSDVVEPVRADSNGAMDVSHLAQVLAVGPKGPTIVCPQAAHLNPGASGHLAAARGGVPSPPGRAPPDGASGVGAAPSPTTSHLTDGVDLADSWGCDAHKWLNVPYDSAFAFCSRPQVQVAAMSYTASYLTGSGVVPGAADYTAESSRRARGFAVWAALSELGRDGVSDLVDRCCRLAQRFAEGLVAAGYEVANEVVLNQVLVSFGDDARTDRVIDAVQREGVCWMGGTIWRGRRFMRISVSNYATTDKDVDRSLKSILRVVDGT